MENQRRGGALLVVGIAMVLGAGAVCWIALHAPSAKTPGLPPGPAAPGATAVAHPSAQTSDWEKRCEELQKRVDALEIKLVAAEERLEVARKVTDPVLREELGKLRLARDAVQTRMEKAEAELDSNAKAVAAARETAASAKAEAAAATQAAKAEAAAATQAAKLSANRAAEIEDGATKSVTARIAAEKTVADLTKRLQDVTGRLATAQAARAAAEKSADDAAKRIKELQAGLAAAQASLAAAQSASKPAPAQ